MPTDAGRRRDASTIAVAPEAPIVAAGLAAALAEAAPEVTVVAMTDLSALPAEADALLYDPQQHSVAEISALRATSPQVLPIAFSWSSASDVVEDARRVGAVALLSKELSGTEVAASLRAIRAGRRDPFVVRPPTVDSRSPLPRPAGLSVRELEVLDLIAQGYSNDEIAAMLYVSINSVKSYVRMGYRKIGATRRTQAVMWAMQHGLGGQLSGRSR